MPVAFTLDCRDREAISWVATTGGIEGSDIRDLMVESMESQPISKPSMLDVLEAGIVSTVLTLPPEKRIAAAAAVMRLLLDQFRFNGIG